jgi:hypothetical protein
MVRKIKIDTREFKQAGDGMAFFKAMLNRYRVGDRVNEDDGLDLTALLNRHDERDEKIGSGIDYFIVEAAPDGHNGRCFWIVQTDGSRVDFSYKHCLAAKPYD